MRVRVIEIPYNLGRELDAVGKGPARLREVGLEKHLTDCGHDVRWTRVERGVPFDDELSATENINCNVAAATRDALSAGAFPLLLCGNCNSSLGGLAALDPPRSGVVWFDAHGDFNTPQTSASGFLDGMALATATGRCHSRSWQRLDPGGDVLDRHILLAGIRDLDALEAQTIEASQVQVAAAAEMTGSAFETGFCDRLDTLRENVTQVYVHVDVDALDPSQAPGVEYKTPHGLTEKDVMKAVNAIADRFEVPAMAVASFSADHDEDDRTALLCTRVITEVLTRKEDAANAG